MYLTTYLSGTTGALILKCVHPLGNFQEEGKEFSKEIGLIWYLHNCIKYNHIWWYFAEGFEEKEGIL